MFEITKDLVSLVSRALLAEFTCMQKAVFLSACIFIQSVHQSIREPFSRTNAKPCLELKAAPVRKVLALWGGLICLGKTVLKIPVRAFTRIPANSSILF